MVEHQMARTQYSDPATGVDCHLSRHDPPDDLGRLGWNKRNVCMYMLLTYRKNCRGNLTLLFPEFKIERRRQLQDM